MNVRHTGVLFTGAAIALLAWHAWSQESRVSGVVAFPDSRQDFTGVRIFVEPGINGALEETHPDPSGQFAFSGPYAGPVGLLAIAPGFGWTGRHLNLSPGESVNDVRLVLRPAVTLSGQVVDSKGKPVADAVVLRAAVTEPFKVGIPFSKLSGLGFGDIRSDASGRFTIPGLPAGSLVALKLAHPSHAQTATPARPVGETVTVTLSPGVLVSGEVVDRALQSRVAGARVTLRNASPPHDTVSLETDTQGLFMTRLNPGVYLARAEATDRLSPGWQEITITGETPETRLRLPVSRAGSISGTLADAITGTPVEGARVRVECGGFTAAIARTDARGAFKVTASEGENVVYFEGTPGYLPPEPRAVRVMVPSGQNVALPGVWLAPLPEFETRLVVDDDQKPVAGAVVAPLEPRQLGWVIADADGTARFRVNRLPESGKVTAMAWHPTERQAALFALDRARPKNNLVRLLPCAHVRGKVLLPDGSPAAGVTVGAVYGAEGLEEPLVLWRAVTDASGGFAWPAVVPGIPQRVVALAADGTELVLGDINAAPGQSLELPAGTLAGGERQAASPVPPEVLAARLREHIQGPALVVALGDASTLTAWTETLAAVCRVVPDIQGAVAAEATGPADAGASVRILPALPAGTLPPGVDTILLDRQGQAVVVTAGLPPLFLVREAAR
ncbi:MAG TPA: carboxypeptidase-like regulatory domain-containing protein [Candidatus Hydrogenedentes bacterium]|nr:carboxypeptidase regulatory-like domain-containing protein [Candidatus Hydrogenedentota bacterium]HOK90230.1 carboxypeptidase-like regulatory domain-containing protein [Candidatus Hydrogenedentota bacterium]